MSQIVTTVYQNVMLRPLTSLGLQKNQRLQIQILQDITVDKTKQVIQSLVGDGLLTPPPGFSQVEPLPEKERRRLSEVLCKASDKPLSEIIMEDRGK